MFFSTLTAISLGVFYVFFCKKRENKQEILQEREEQLQNNWNELNRVLNGLLDNENDFYSGMRIKDLLKLMQEIENRNLLSVSTFGTSNNDIIVSLPCFHFLFI